MCEQVVQDVYAQKGQVIVEIPEDFSVSITETTITVKAANNRRGKVIAKLHNGELVMTREMETDNTIGNPCYGKGKQFIVSSDCDKVYKNILLNSLMVYNVETLYTMSFFEYLHYKTYS